MTYYKISADQLRDLLIDSATLKMLESGGVDNWSYYGENWTEYVAMMLGVTEEEVENDDLDFSDIAYRQMQDYEIIKED